VGSAKSTVAISRQLGAQPFSNVLQLWQKSTASASTTPQISKRQATHERHQGPALAEPPHPPRAQPQRRALADGHQGHALQAQQDGQAARQRATAGAPKRDRVRRTPAPPQPPTHSATIGGWAAREADAEDPPQSGRQRRQRHRGGHTARGRSQARDHRGGARAARASAPRRPRRQRCAPPTGAALHGRHGVGASAMVVPCSGSRTAAAMGV